MKTITVNEMLMHGAWASLHLGEVEVTTERKHCRIRVAIGDQEEFGATIHMATTVSWELSRIQGDSVGLYQYRTGGKPELLVPFGGIKECVNGEFTVIPIGD